MLPEEGPLHGAAGVGEVADPELDHVLPGSDPGRQRQQLVGERAGVPGARDALGPPPTPPQAQAGGGGGHVRHRRRHRLRVQEEGVRHRRRHRIEVR